MQNRHILFFLVILSSLAACSSPPATAISPAPSPTAIAMTTHTDDTGAITVSLPSSWSDVDGTPYTTDTVTYPQLKAATSIRNFDILAGPGVLIQAVRNVSMTQEDYTTAIMTELSAFLFESSCQSLPEKPYYDGKYEGKKQLFSNCHNSGNTVEVLVVNQVDTDIMVEIIFVSLSNQTSADIAPVLKSTMESLNVDSELFR